jgi:hypothetical protein
VDLLLQIKICNRRRPHNGPVSSGICKELALVGVIELLRPSHIGLASDQLFKAISRKRPVAIKELHLREHFLFQMQRSGSISLEQMLEIEPPQLTRVGC